MGVLRLLAGTAGSRPPIATFHGWVSASHGEQTARAAANLMGVLTFDADSGRLSAAFVWERMVRVFTAMPPSARYILGGWGSMLGRLEAHARHLDD
jgi:hypothetical protein